MGLSSVDQLSDDDGDVKVTTKLPEKKHKASGRKLRDRTHVRSLVARRCKCSENCMQPFRTVHVFDKLFKWVSHLDKLHKLEQDSCIFNLLRATNRSETYASHSLADDDPKRQKLSYVALGFPVCKGAFKALVGLGSDRLVKIARSVVDGKELPPHDLRFVKKSNTQIPDVKHAAVFEYLQGLYDKVAEPLPDSHRCTKRPRFREYKFDGPINETKPPKQLPPGSFADYHRLCQDQLKDMTISYKLFATVWQKGFAECLKVRQSGHHSKCSQCIKHRIVIRSLAKSTYARQCQIGLFQKHLKRTYDDRLVYWAARARSRLGGPAVSLILDSMDQQKHAWPRSPVMLSKQFNTFNRPRLTNTTLICHGHHVITSLSPPFLPSNASRSCDILMHSLHLLSQKMDLRSVCLDIQADNCSKEAKNNACLRLCSLLISTHTIGQATLNFLESGHSHEDIDAHFKDVATWLQRHPELHTREAFRSCLDEYHQLDKVRPLEASKFVLSHDQVRDWKLCFSIILYFVFELSMVA